MGLNSWRYQRQLSPAIQEFIEALSFQHYVETQTLITIEQVAARLPTEILITDEDYLLGLFDLTGEIMRFAVTSLSTGGLAAQEQQQKQKQKRRESKNETEQSGSDNPSNTSTNNNPQLPPSQGGIVVDLREIRSSLESMSIPPRHSIQREFGKKVEVMQNSVEKVERAAYGILVRGSERPSGWLPDLSNPVEVEGY